MSCDPPLWLEMLATAGVAFFVTTVILDLRRR